MGKYDRIQKNKEIKDRDLEEAKNRLCNPFISMLTKYCPSPKGFKVSFKNFIRFFDRIIRHYRISFIFKSVVRPDNLVLRHLFFKELQVRLKKIGFMMDDYDKELKELNSRHESEIFFYRIDVKKENIIDISTEIGFCHQCSCPIFLSKSKGLNLYDYGRHGKDLVYDPLPETKAIIKTAKMCGRCYVYTMKNLKAYFNRVTSGFIWNDESTHTTLQFRYCEGCKQYINMDSFIHNFYPLLDDRLIHHYHHCNICFGKEVRGKINKIVNYVLEQTEVIEFEAISDEYNLYHLMYDFKTIPSFNKEIPLVYPTQLLLSTLFTNPNIICEVGYEKIIIRKTTPESLYQFLYDHFGLDSPIYIHEFEKFYFDLINDTFLFGIYEDYIIKYQDYFLKRIMEFQKEVKYIKDYPFVQYFHDYLKTKTNIALPNEFSVVL